MGARARIRVYLVAITIGLIAVGWLYWDTAGRYRHTLAGQPGQEYWLYAPKQCRDSADCPLLVFVHGTGGSGQTFINLWQPYADREDFVVVCPTFQLGYQTLDGGEDKALLAILGEVSQRYPTAGKPLISGFSGGAQFAHRFAFAHPDQSGAVAAHSAGWYDAPPPQARRVPFVVTIGLEDAKRVEWARWFAAGLERNGNEVTLIEIAGVGHSLSGQAIQATIELLRRLEHNR